MSLAPYQQGFIDFLVRSQALTFGDFVTKSGRKTPYFINTGRFDTGAKIAELGRHYAAHIASRGLDHIDVVFGPAYKGIPLAVATASALYSEHQRNVGFTFDRKEVKDHGDGGIMVGFPLKDGTRLIIVEDVITAGTTLRAILPLLSKVAKVDVVGTVISVDRCEKGSAELSAVQEVEQTLGVKVYPIVTIRDIVGYLSKANNSGLTLNQEILDRISAYWEQYVV